MTADITKHNIIG